MNKYCKIIEFYFNNITKEEVEKLWKLNEINKSFKNGLMIIKRSRDKKKLLSPSQVLVGKMVVVNKIVNILFKNPLLPKTFLPKDWKGEELKKEFSKCIKQKKKPETTPGKVTVTAFLNGWRPAQNIVFERAKRAALEFGDKVVFQEIGTFDREVFLKWGITDALFIDKKQVRTGQPPSYEKIKNLIAKRVKKL
ncbi:MAG: hypothetical protein KKC53_01275 [Actinobacteria bacterium]|nr:hypothetical protein [Actinomycetota bacterium]